MASKIYSFSINYEDENDEHIENGLIAADSYQSAMNSIIEYYGDDCIVTVQLTEESELGIFTNYKTGSEFLDAIDWN